MSSIIDIFGFHNQYISDPNRLVTDEDKSLYLKHNVTHILGYFPLVGLIIGIMRIVQSRKEMEKDLPSEKQAGYAVLQVRGAFEIIGAGVLFLFPDLIITAIRAASAYQRRKNEL